MAFTATTQWDVRTTGSDSNGGGFDTALTGTNFAQQDSAQITYTDLVIDGTTNTKCTSAGNPFTSAHVGNIINITSGTGFSVQRVLILSVAAATATCDKSLGTLSSTGGNGKLGGGLLTIGTANGLAISGNTLNIKAGTYTQTTAIVIPSANGTITFMGYGTTWADGGTRPLITCATNSVNLITTSSATTGFQLFDNLSLSHTAAARAIGLLQLSNHGSTQFWVLRKCILDGFTDGINSDNVGAHFDIADIAVIGTEIKNCSGMGINATSTSRLWVQGSYLHNNTLDNLQISGTLFMDHTISVLSGASGVNTNNGSCHISNSTIANNTGRGIWMSGGSAFLSLYNTIVYGNLVNNNIVGGGVPAASSVFSRNNAYVASANNAWSASPGDVTLTVSPFTGAPDYSLNATAGGGAACKGAGYPGAFTGGGSTGTLDIGAVQSAGGGVAGGVVVNPGMTGGFK